MLGTLQPFNVMESLRQGNLRHLERPRGASWGACQGILHAGSEGQYVGIPETMLRRILVFLYHVVYTICHIHLPVRIPEQRFVFERPGSSTQLMGFAQLRSCQKDGISRQ